MYRYVMGALVLLAACSSPLASQILEGRVVTVFDGDSFILLMEEEQIQIRMAQIDTPELGQAWHDEASEALKRKILRQRVRVNIVDRDRYNRLVGTVWLGSRDINREMIAEGHAWAYRQYLRDESLMEVERQARDRLLGLWGDEADPTPPWRWRHKQRGGETSQPAQRCRIKGNISRSGERIYHMPGQEYYQATQISTSQGERWFCSEAAARAAGWRKARR